MLDPLSLRVGIDPRISSGQLTGIGNYSLNLLLALIEEFPELDYRAYSRFSWRAVSAFSLREIARSKGKDSAGLTSVAVQARISGYVRHRLSRNAATKYAYDQIVTSASRQHFARTIARQQLQLFHAFNFLPLADPGIPTLPVVYDLSFVRFPHTHPADRLRRLAALPQSLQRASLIHTISEFSKSEIGAVYSIDPRRIVVAPPAASSIFSRRGITETNADLSLFDLTYGDYFLAVGTLEPRKNLRTLIEAFSRMTSLQRQKHPLVVVGGAGWGDIDLPRVSAAMRSDGSLRFVGSVTDNKLRSLYEGARALLFPSIYEGFGMPVVEAFSCGTQVVHGKNTSMSEITRDLAAQVAAEDVDDWGLAIGQLLDQTNAERNASLDARISRANEFSWTRSAHIVRDMYRRLLGG